MKRSPAALTQPRALAAQRLRQQEPRLPGHVERGRMELHELEVRDARACALRHRHAVAGRHRRVGRLAEDLPGAAGREQDRARRARTAMRRRPSCRNRDADAAAVLDDQLDGPRVIVDA